MAFIQCGFFSDVLKRSVSINVILPENCRNLIGMASSGSSAVDEEGRIPVLYLLHGMSDDHTIWQRRTSIERYAADYGIAVVMADGQRSYYRNMAYGGKFWQFFTEELPMVASSFFPISRKRENCYAAGLSMGGYGAFKLAFCCPEKFAAVGAFSAVADLPGWITRPDEPIWGQEMLEIFGENWQNLSGTDDDLFHLADLAAEKGIPLPRLWIECGTEDALYQGNEDLKNHLEKLGCFSFEFCRRPGAHTWDFWDTAIQHALEFMLKK